MDYNPNVGDQVRRVYLQRGPCQPRNHNFSQKQFGVKLRRFNQAWYSQFGNWLEYSVSKDAAFCLYCYLFKPNVGEQAGGEIFVNEGFSNWKRSDKFQTHVGGVNSSHNQAWRKCQDLLNQKQSIEAIFFKQSDQVRSEYKIRLKASVDCIRFLLRQGFAFRGHNESENSNNQGNFLELLRFLTDHNEDIRAVVLKNAPENLKLTAPEIQKDIVNATAIETCNAITTRLGDVFFSVLVDESRNVSIKEQMTVVLGFVDKKGHAVEHLLGFEHVTNTNALSLKTSIEDLFARHGLSLSRLRGQGYDGANNMRDEFNGLKVLIMKENASAYYVYCFSHQLQLALVAVAKNHIQIATLFNLVANIVNVVGSSCKRRDILREKQVARVLELLDNKELPSGRGLNQETNLKCAYDTRWGSHYNSLISLIDMFSFVIDVLDVVSDDGINAEQRGEANVLLDLLQSFEFVFTLHLMRITLGITNELSQALQRKDQDIVNAIKLVQVSKQRLQTMRENGWGSFLDDVSSSFCEKHEIVIPDTNGIFKAWGRSRRTQEKTNLQHFRVELFYTVLDIQLQELNTRFTESSTELLFCVACLSPSNSFSVFDKEKLVRLVQFYPKEFSSLELMMLSDQLDSYIIDIRSSIEFSNLLGIGDLAKTMVKTKRNVVYPLVYLLVTLALILPVAIATVKRAFSAMKIVKNRLHNRMGDQWMIDNLIVYIENDIFDCIDNEIIMHRFQNMKTRRGQL